MEVALSDYGERARDPRAWNKMMAGSIITSRTTLANIPHASFAIIEHGSLPYTCTHTERIFNHQLNISYLLKKKSVTRWIHNL